MNKEERIIEVTGYSKRTPEHFTFTRKSKKRKGKLAESNNNLTNPLSKFRDRSQIRPLLGQLKRRR